MFVGKLSPKGEEVVASSRGVLEALTRLGLEKNNDDKVELFCCFLLEGFDADVLYPHTSHPYTTTKTRFNASSGALRTPMLTSMSTSRPVRLFCTLYKYASLTLHPEQSLPTSPSPPPKSSPKPTTPSSSSVRSSSLPPTSATSFRTS